MNLRDTNVKLGEHVWSVKFRNRRKFPDKKAWGLCDWETKTIWVRNDLCPVNVLDTLLHELTHGQRNHEAEEYVNEKATELAKAMIEVGVLE